MLALDDGDRWDLAQTTIPDVRTRTFRAMASQVTFVVVDPSPGADAALERAESVVREVERTCSRFDAASDLVRANAAPHQWHEVPARLAHALAEAGRAHEETAGLFDPRVLEMLLSWGSAESMPAAEGPLVRAVGLATRGREAGSPTSAFCEPWRPRVARDGSTYRVHLGGTGVDLGGIGKGLAVRWAAAELGAAGRGSMIDAGGDLAFSGSSPDGGAWRVGIEDPFGGDEPVLVLEVNHGGCATSSIRRHRWTVADEQVHHLVDPRTRLPGGRGLAAVTVADPDPARSEVWSKALFLTGGAAIGTRADELGLAAAWVRLDGRVGVSAAMEPLTIWRRPSTQGPTAGEGQEAQS